MSTLHNLFTHKRFMHLSIQRFPWKLSIGLFCLLLFTACLYYPGLHGVFLLDDYSNIADIELIKQYGYQYYVFGGFAGPSGRPLSLLSFALQHQSWPHAPFAFKLVNLLIHLLNGVLVFLICRLLTIPLQLRTHAGTAIALLTTALWLLHPIQVSTVLYAVQRMTQLSAFFMLLGLWAYLWIRIRNPELSLRNLCGMSIAVGLGMLFGILSKENAILLPLYILVIEYTLLTDLPKTRAWKIWAATFLILPLLILLVYFSITLDTMLASYTDYRDFTPMQRLLTQPIVLFDYLHSLILPRPSLFSLFHDDYVFSTNLTTPITLIAIISWVILLSLAIFFRTGRFKIVSFAILWFFCGHLLEGSHLNLELYFEHRNYLPSLSIFFLLAWLAIQIWYFLANKILASFLITFFYALIIGNSVYQILLWSNPLRQAYEWHNLHPQSARALDHLAIIYLQLELYDHAIKTSQRIKEIQPLNMSPDLMRLAIYTCYLKEPLPKIFWEEMMQQTENAKPYSLATVTTLNRITTDVISTNCQMTIEDKHKLIYLIVKLAMNKNFIFYKKLLHILAAKLYIHINEPKAALENINTALENINTALGIAPIAGIYTIKIKILLTLKMLATTKNTLDEFKEFLNKKPNLWLSNRKTIENFEVQWLELANSEKNLKEN